MAGEKNMEVAADVRPGSRPESGDKNLQIYGHRLDFIRYLCL